MRGTVTGDAIIPPSKRGHARSQSTSTGAAHKGCGASRIAVARAHPSCSPSGCSSVLGLPPPLTELRAQLGRRASQSSIVFVGMCASARAKACGEADRRELVRLGTRREAFSDIDLHKPGLYTQCLSRSLGILLRCARSSLPLPP